MLFTSSAISALICSAIFFPSMSSILTVIILISL
jgi:hypothetical protein